MISMPPTAPNPTAARMYASQRVRCTSTPIAAAAAGSSCTARLSSPNRLRTSR